MAMATGTVPTLRTPGVVARELGAPLHRVQYILRSRGIAPAARAGRLRLLDAKGVGAIREALAGMDARRGRR
jgi:hypothetical protein